MSESGRETLPAVREWWVALPNVQKLLRVPPGLSGRPSRMCGSGREALADVL